jgi:hypothetical protein
VLTAPPPSAPGAADLAREDCTKASDAFCAVLFFVPNSSQYEEGSALIYNPYFDLWLAMITAAAAPAQPTPEERRAAFTVIEGGRAA